MILVIFVHGCSKERDPEQRVDGWYITGSTYQQYEIGIDDKQFNGKPIYYLEPIAEVKDGYGAICTEIIRDKFLNKKVKLSGYMKTEDADWAAMWMRADGGTGSDSYFGKTLAFYNMDDRPIKGTTDWKEYKIVLNIPDNARMIFYGATLGQRGKLWISDFSLDTVSMETPTDR